MSTEMQDAIHQRLLELAETLVGYGWDQPNGLYVVEEVDGDPYLIKVFEFINHPLDFLAHLPPADQPRAKGIVLTYEGWAIEPPKEWVETINQKMDELEVPEELRPPLMERVMGLLPRPKESPDRIETRFIQCQMRTGESYAAIHRRGDEPEILDSVMSGRVYDALKSIICVEVTS